MADTTAITTLANLKLSAEEREQVAGLAGDVIAVQVYRELQKAASRASDSGCNIIGNCSSSSKNALLAK
jgi:predicted kinase